MAQDPKSLLSQGCRKYIQRTIVKDDVNYNSTNHEGVGWQSIVSLTCIGLKDGIVAPQYAGDVCTNQKEAEKSAAGKALEAYAAMFDLQMPAAGAPVKSGKRKASAAGLVPNDGLTPEEREAKRAYNTAAGVNPKTNLNGACIKLVGRCMVKGDLAFTTIPVPGGFQSSVQVAALPGGWGQMSFTGELAADEKAAEQSAATTALATFQSDPTFAAKLAEPPAPKKKFEGGKGKGKKGGGNWQQDPQMQQMQQMQQMMMMMNGGTGGKGAAAFGGKGGKGKGKQPRGDPNDPMCYAFKATGMCKAGAACKWQHF